MEKKKKGESLPIITDGYGKRSDCFAPRWYRTWIDLCFIKEKKRKMEARIFFLEKKKKEIKRCGFFQRRCGFLSAFEGD